MSAFQRGAKLFDELRGIAARHNIVIVIPGQQPKKPEFEHSLDGLMIVNRDKTPTNEKVVVFQAKSREPKGQAFDLYFDWNRAFVGA
jgi:hypothetical protein